MTYREYLSSPWWVARKAAIVRYRGYRCERCAAEPNFGLQLHHRTYARLFRERPDDLELLCESCHMKEHNLVPEPGEFVPPPPPFDLMAIEEIIRRQYPYGVDE